MNNSVTFALCTCDGKDYLQQQLTSLMGQTKPPCEAVVCDDASIDCTPRLIDEFMTQTTFPVRVVRNTNRIGVGKNFEQAITLSSGDIIALSDQDDVWEPDKLARFKKEFAAGFDWVCCDAQVVDAELAPLGYTLWERTNFTAKEQECARQGRIFEVLLKHYVIAGATLAFRADLRDKALPIPPNWHYDAWLALILSATAKGAILETPLQQYRQHDANVIGGVKRGLLREARAVFSLDRKSYFQAEIARWSQLAERLGVLDAPVHYQAQLVAKIEHLERRLAFPGIRIARVPGIVNEILRGGYARYARNWGSIAVDLFSI